MRRRRLDLLRRLRRAQRCPLLATLLVAADCDEPTAMPAPMHGDVVLTDEWGDRLPSAEGVHVSLTDRSGTVLAETVTDGSGRFALERPRAPAELALVFTLDGFGTTYRYGVTDEVGRVELFARSTATVTMVVAQASRCGTPLCLNLSMEVDSFFAEESSRRVFRLFLGPPGVDEAHHPVTDLLFVPNHQPGLVRHGSSASFTLDGLSGMLIPFSSGDTLEVLIHGATENLTNSYTDPDTGLEVFTDLSPVSARSTVILFADVQTRPDAPLFRRERVTRAMLSFGRVDPRGRVP